ncbi:MAG: polyribonucleotide nucleotidyltransferase, partial [Candidatus Sumerlaeota bacterium]|nr:polyribonucleotide nucleotidyltransferase [Candidatus Sumerlaeota bacterium]
MFTNAETQRLPYGKEDLILEYGRLAKQAQASVLATVGGTVVLVSVVADDNPSPQYDFFPLMVDYREKFYSAGKFPGGFFKREGR